MIESTFCHLPGISLAEERDLWRKGLGNWDDLLCWAAVFVDDSRYGQIQEAIAGSRAAIISKKPMFFLERLPESEWFRVYSDFRSQVHCLDIETDGLQKDSQITCLSLLNAGKMRSFLLGEDLESAAETLCKIRIAVTFNGARFDIPRLMRRFSGFHPRFHIDLARLLGKQKIRGSLVDVATRFGWKQHEEVLAVSNGEEAARAWNAYQRSGDHSILEELRAYNQKDVRMLDHIVRALVKQHARMSSS